MHPSREPAFGSISMDDWEATVESISVRKVIHRSVPEPEALRKVTEILSESRRSATIAGSWIARELSTTR
jgi:thiamine pyrophosphate-dependent acetolactate synthase large subunit-like protein